MTSDTPREGEPRAKSAGERPKSGERKAFLLRVDPDLMEELRAWAGAELRSLNAHLEYLLRDALRRRRNKPGED